MKRFFLWRILFNRPKAGEIYVSSSERGNPFSTRRKYVEDVKGGWVKYQRSDADVSHSLSINEFNLLNIKIEEEK